MEHHDTKCGLSVSCCCCSDGLKRSFHCKPLQRFATPKWALAFISFAGILQGFVVQGLTRVVITTLEKRFGLSSTESAAIVSCYDAASLISIPIVTYFGGRGRKPLWIGWGIVFHAIGSLAFSLPHFASPSYLAIATDSGAGLCGANLTVGATEGDLNSYKYFFVVANLLNGLGTTAIFTLGMTYLDENVSQKVSSTYHAIYYALQSALGPALGFVLGGLSLNLYTNIGESVEIDNTNASWVGAWWLGFIIASSLLFVASDDCQYMGCIISTEINKEKLPLLLLPKKMPGREDEDTNTREQEVHRSSADILDESEPPKKSIKNLILTNLKLLKNVPLILTALATAFDYGLIVGMSSYTPKYLESVFGLSASEASITMGIVSIAGASLGLITGGVLVTKGKLRVRGIMKFCFVNTILALICSFSFLIRCPNTGFAGATLPYAGGDFTSAYEFTSSCNSLCRCSTDFYAPVCGRDGITYFSPCHAGCSSATQETFANCTCIPNLHEQRATNGKCPGADCNGLPIFMCTFFLLVFFTLICLTPSLQIILRIVPFRQRSVAVGMQWIFNKALGVAFPVVVGPVLDLTCLVWNSKLGKTASCRVYSTHQMSLYMFLMVMCCKICSLLCYGGDQLIYKPVKARQDNETATSGVEA